PKCMTKLILREKQRLGEVPETGLIEHALEKAISHCDRRNLLAHGTWWRFDPVQQVITVRRGINRPNEELHVYITVDDIDAAIVALRQLEVELDRLQASIRKRLPEE